MMSSLYFTSDTTPGLPNKDTSPSFSYIQPNGVDKICLVIDVSGSMSVSTS